MKTCMLGLVLPLVIAGQAPFSPATLEGTVTDATTKQPVAGARLIFSIEVKAVTGADGRFRIAGLPPERHAFYTARAGFLPLTQTVTLESGQTLSNWRVELTRTSEISGRVVDQDGWPADGCAVEALRWVYRNGKQTLESRGSAQTNDLGEFWIGGLEPGRYYVRSSPFGFLSWWDSRYGVTFYPAAASVSDAEAIDLAASAPHAPVSIRMMRRQGVRVTGEVVLPETGISRYAGIQVSLDCDNSNVHPCLHAGVLDNRLVRNRFVIQGVPPGTYTLQARVEPISTPDGTQPLLAAYRRIEVGTSDLGGFVLQLEPQTPRDLPATVAFETDTRADDLYFFLQPNDASTIQERVKPDGSLVFRNVVPGRYQSLSMYDNVIGGTMLYLKAARLVDEDILGRPFDISNEPGAALRLTVGAVAMARVQGVLTDADGNRAGEATAVLVPTSARPPMSVRTVVADQKGAFTCWVPEGEYRVLAWKTAGSADTLADPQLLRSKEGRTIVLKPGPNAALNLSLAR